MRNKLVLLTLIFVVSLLSEDTKQQNSSSRLEIELKYGSLSSSSNEIVYYPTPSYDSKLSHLIWEQYNATIYGVETKYYKDSHILSANIFFSPSEQDGVMDDYDWFYTGYDWSHHENTKFSKFILVDFLYQYKLINQNDNIYATFDMGILMDEKEFRAYDGTYTYSSEGNFRDETGSISGLGISYNQSYTTPYIGSTIYTSNGILEMSVTFKYSEIGMGYDKDIHHLRDLRYESIFYNTHLFSFDIKTKLAITNSLKISLGYLMSKYAIANGYTSIYQDSTNTLYYFRNKNAGISSEYNIISVGLSYIF